MLLYRSCMHNTYLRMKIIHSLLYFHAFRAFLMKNKYNAQMILFFSFFNVIVNSTRNGERASKLFNAMKK